MKIKLTTVVFFLNFRRCALRNSRRDDCLNLVLPSLINGIT